MLRRAGFAATLAAGVSLLGVSLHGITNVDQQLKIAAATPTPAPQLEVVQEWRVRDCDKPDRDEDRDRHHGPEV
jgi:hypothetical protein